LKINSPGGSPIQSHLIAKYIRNQSEKHQVPLFCFVEDKAASGGYLVGSARALELGLVDGIYTVMEDKGAELIGDTKF
jgi:hypothetical protein